MAEITTVARPYAEAVFERAQETASLPHWSEMLAAIVAIANVDSMADLIAGAKLSRSEVAEVFIEVGQSQLDEEANNLIRLLAEYGRLDLLEEIAAQFEALRAHAEGSIEAEMISAYDVTDGQRNKVIEALKKRLGREINLTVTINKDLVGGAIIRAGDMVIDGSVSGKLNKLASTVNQ